MMSASSVLVLRIRIGLARQELQRGLLFTCVQQCATLRLRPARGVRLPAFASARRALAQSAEAAAGLEEIRLKADATGDFSPQLQRRLSGRFFHKVRTSRRGDMMRRVSVGLVVGLLLYASPAFTQGGSAPAKARAAALEIPFESVPN